MKKIVIRADGNEHIGAGHIMRCMSIAKAAKSLGIDVSFVTADQSFLSILQYNGFKVYVLDSDYKAMEIELDVFLPVLLKEKPDAVIMDSYYVTPYYMESVKNITKLVYIDDVLSFPYPTDILINYNIYASKTKYLKLYGGKKIPTMLLGCKYIPLRDEFQDGKAIKIKPTVESILFSAGGADPERIAIRFVESIIANKNFNNIVFHIVLSSFEPDCDQIEEICKSHTNVVLHSNVSRMSDLMLQCDLAVSAAGSTLYELCACGVPTITYVLADNQLPGATAFSDLGIMVNAGDYRTDEDLIKNITNKILSLVSDVEIRRIMQSKGMSFVNGNGAKKIVQEIM